MIERAILAKALSTTFADKLDWHVIDVSQEIAFTRREMIEDLDCGNFVAAARLSTVLKRLKIFTVAQLYRTDPASLLRAKGVGEATVYVAMCLLHARKYDVYKWWGWKQDSKTPVKFATYQHQVKKRATKRKHSI